MLRHRPQLTLYSDPTRTSAFLRSRAEVLGPGTYVGWTEDPVSTRAPGQTKPVFDSHTQQQLPARQHLASTGFELKSAQHWGPKRPPGTLNQKGYSWARKPRITQTVAKRDPGQDVFHSNSVKTIGWSISNSSGLKIA